MKIFLMTTFLFSNVFASDYTNQIWSHKNDHYVVAHNSKTNLYISEYCLHAKTKCEAMSAFEQTEKIKLPPGSVTGGKNPAAIICSAGLKQKVIILKDKNEDENSFCLFNDGSIISTSSLNKLI